MSNIKRRARGTTTWLIRAGSGNDLTTLSDRDLRDLGLVRQQTSQNQIKTFPKKKPDADGLTLAHPSAPDADGLTLAHPSASGFRYGLYEIRAWRQVKRPDQMPNCRKGDSVESQTPRFVLKF